MVSLRMPRNPGGSQRRLRLRSHASGKDYLERYRPLVGEFAWHIVTLDPTIEQVSEEHFHLIKDLLNKWEPQRQWQGLRILEVASYAHTTGYRLAELGAHVTLFEISPQTLELGRKTAGQLAQTDRVRLVVGDFHHLPFADGAFDLVYICSALHHTWRWQQVLRELLRVVAPTGLLFLKNEPCHRAACFYGFRTNREYAYTAFEKKLQELGVLKTFAEPFPGSRPETLFGMIENQRMPVHDIWHELNQQGDCLESVITPAIGAVEGRWLEWRHTSQPELASRVAESLLQARAEALAAFTEQDEGLGFRLAGETEIEGLSQEIAHFIKALPEEGQAHQLALAQLFGASLRLLVRKRPRANAWTDFLGTSLRRLLGKRPVREAPAGHPPLSGKGIRHNGMHFTLAPDLSKILLERTSRLPAIQQDTPEKVATAFPASQWSYFVPPSGIKNVVLNASAGEIHIPANPDGNLLVIVRLYVGAGTSGGYRVLIRHRTEQLFSFDVWQNDSILFTHILKATGECGVTLTVERQPLSEQNQAANVGPVNVYLAVAFDV